MDKFLNLNLNILMASANTHKKKKMWKIKGASYPSASVWIQHKLFPKLSVADYFQQLSQVQRFKNGGS